MTPDDIKTAVRDVLTTESFHSSIIDAMSAKGPTCPESERVLSGAFLAGHCVERDLSPVRAVDFATPLCRAAFLACCIIESREPVIRLPKALLAMEADGIVGVRMDDLLYLVDACQGHRLERHIAIVHEFGEARRMASYLERVAKDLRTGNVTAAQAEQRLRKKLEPCASPTIRQVPAITATTRTRGSTGS